MKRALALMLFAGMACSTGARAAAPERTDIVSNFKSLCLDNAKAPFDAVSKAEANHWIVAPDRYVTVFANNDKVDRFEARMAFVDRSMLILGVADMNDSSFHPPGDPPVKAKACYVGGVNIDNASVKTALESALGAPRGKADPLGASEYLFIDGKAGRRFVVRPESDAGTQKLYMTAGFRTVTLQVTPSVTIIALGEPDR